MGSGPSDPRGGGDSVGCRVRRPGGRFREDLFIGPGEPDAPGRNGVFVFLRARLIRAGTIRVESSNISVLSPSWMRENPQLGAEPGD